MISICPYILLKLMLYLSSIELKPRITMTLNKFMRLVGVNKNIIKLQGTLSRMSKSHKLINRRVPNQGITYLLTDGQNYKIGMTTRWIDQRVKELNSSTSTYREITVVAYSDNDDCYGLEKSLHRKYYKERIHSGREWFQLSDIQIQEIKDIFLEASGVTPTSKTSTTNVILGVIGFIFLAWIVTNIF